MLRINVAIFSVFVFSGAAFAVEYEEVAERLIEAQSKLKTYSAKIKSSHQISKVMKYESEGTYEWKRDGDKILYHSDLRRVGTRDFDGEKMVVKEHRSTLCDGKNIYRINHENGNVYKEKYDDESWEAQNVAAMLDSMYARHSSIKVLADEKVGGHDCYVLEGIDDWADEDSEDDPMITVVKHVYWFAKDTGMPVKLAGYDGKGNTVVIGEYFDIKRNSDISGERFTYKAPANVNLVDATKD